MTHSFKLSRRIARLRVATLAVLSLALVACDSSDSLNPDDSLAEGVDLGAPADPISSIEDDAPVAEEDLTIMEVGEPTMASASFAGGIPFGNFHQPTGSLGSTYNGALRNIWPAYLVKELSAIKGRGGKVVLSLAGGSHTFKDAAGNFSLSKWKQRIDRFRGVNFNAYINDGTVIAHYLVDEPNDPTDWNGKKISPSTLEEMARYSKQLWPNMPTVVRADASYFAYNHRYLDAAWAQYVYRKGTASDYISKNVSAAKARGLALITGMNILKGGPKGAKMSASQVKSWGSTILNNSYPCAFISWQYNNDYLSTSAMRDAMNYLRRKAQNRSLKTCR